jgi:large subunit ribosomal protein L22
LLEATRNGEPFKFERRVSSMAKGHRSQIKRERNANKDQRPSAKLSYARVSVQKACFVLDAIRGKDVATALGILAYNPRYASTLIEKLLKSAIANAENNNGMDVNKLYIQECYANCAPTMKRIHPRSQGRAYRILKRMSHITIVLNER